MTESEDPLRRQISLAHAEALRVGDSPLRADQVADRVQLIVREVDAAGLGPERRARVAACLQDALRVLRRDDDGREAARHLQAALAQFDPPPRRPSPFDD